jgi:hypothetical protein
VSMAQVIEFYTLARFTPTVNWTPDEQRGKVIPFMSQREVSDELVCRNISPRSARSTVPCLVLDERHERYPGCFTPDGSSADSMAQARTLLQPLCKGDVSESYESLIL